MRVLLASRNFFPLGIVGGAQVSMHFLARALEELGHEVAVLSVDTHDRVGINPVAEIKEYRLRLKNLYARGTPPSLVHKVGFHLIDRYGSFMDRKYLDVIEDFSPDIINTNVLAGMGLGIWRAARLADKPVVHTVHDYYLLCVNSGMRAKQRGNCLAPCLGCRMHALNLSRKVESTVSGVIFVSEHMRKAHQSAQLFCTDKSPSCVIHGSYDPGSSIGLGREDFHGSRKLRIGLFGRVSPEKGLDRVIEQLRMLPVDRWCLRVGGTGEDAYINHLKHASQGLPIDWIGVKAPADFYPTVDVVIVPSLWNEPAARVAYESGIHRAIPIVSNRGGLPELVQYGRRGLIYEPDIADNLVHCINELLVNPSLLTSLQRAWDDWADDFSPVAVALKTLAFYRSVQ